MIKHISFYRVYTFLILKSVEFHVEYYNIYSFVKVDLCTV